MNKVDFHYSGVDITYDRSECTCDPDRDSGDYCRRTRIISTKVKNVEIEKIKANLTMLKKSGGKPLKLHPLDNYCVDRLLRSHKIYDKDLWEIEVESGYYGEEIGGVFFKGQENLFADIEKLLKLQKNEEKMEFVLGREYGYILDVLKNKTWEISTIFKNQIVQKQETYHKKVEKCDFYKDWKLPVCVVLDLSDGKYRMIDGYHRLVMSENDKIDVIVAR